MIRLKVVFDTPEQMAAVYNVFRPRVPITDAQRNHLYIRPNHHDGYIVYVGVADPSIWKTVHINELLKTYRSTDRGSEGIGAEVHMSSVQPQDVVREPRDGDVSMLSSNVQFAHGTTQGQLSRETPPRIRREELQRQATTRSTAFWTTSSTTSPW